MAMEEPRTRVVGLEPDGDVIPSQTNAHNISNDGVVEVVGRATGAPYNMEVVSMQMNGVLFSSNRQESKILTIIREHSQVRREHHLEW